MQRIQPTPKPTMQTLTSIGEVTEFLNERKHSTLDQISLEIDELTVECENLLGVVRCIFWDDTRKQIENVLEQQVLLLDLELLPLTKSRLTAYFDAIVSKIACVKGSLDTHRYNHIEPADFFSAHLLERQELATFEDFWHEMSSQWKESKCPSAEEA